MSIGGPITGGSGGGTAVQAFAYTVTGSEPDLDNLVIPLPSTRGSTNYSVVPSQQTFTSLLAMGVQNGTKTTSQFVLNLSADATAGDVFAFVVGDL